MFDAYGGRRTLVACGGLMMILLVLGFGAGGASAKAATAASSSLVKPFPKTPAPKGGNGGATAIGVTRTQIMTGTPESATGSLPGAEIADLYGVKAYFQYVNESGGVYGRKLVTERMETGFDANVGVGVCQHDIPSLFALVGTMSNVDTACYPLVKRTGIPWIGYWNDPNFGTLPNAVASIASNYPGVVSNIQCAMIKAAFPHVTKVAIIWLDVAGVDGLLTSDEHCWKSVGVKTVYTVGTTPSTANMTPYIIQARSSGAQVVDAFGQDVTTAAPIAQAMQQQNWHPIADSFSIYDPTWHKLAGTGAAGWVGAPFWSQGPYLNASEMNKVKGGAIFEKFWHKLYGNATINTFAIAGFESAAYFVQGLVNAGPDLTRAKYLAAAKAIKNWNNLGLSAPVHWRSPGKPADVCGATFEATATGFKKVAPAAQGYKNGFICPGKYSSGG